MSYATTIRQKIRSMSQEALLETLRQRTPTENDESFFGLLDLALGAGAYADGIVEGCATIANTLYEHIKDEIQDTTSIQITGCDGPNITEPDYPWKDYMEDWLNSGVHIDYLLTEPSDEAIRLLKEIHGNTKDAHGKLQLWIATETHETTSSKSHSSTEEQKVNQAWLKRIKRTHFVIFQNPAMLWLENDHPKGTTTADGCVFYGKNNPFGAAVGTTLKQRFVALCDSPLTEQVL